MELDIQHIIAMVKKKWKVFLCCSVAGAIAAFLVANFLVAPTYNSQSRFFVTVKNDISVNADTANGVASANTKTTYTTKMIPTYFTLLQTNQFYQNLQQAMGSDLSLAALKNAISYTQSTDTSVFTVSVTTKDPDISKRIADYLTESVPKTITDSDTLIDVKNIDPPMKGGAVGANSLLYGLIGLVLGLALAYAYALIRNMLDVHFKVEEDITNRYNLPLLGVVPDYEGKTSRKGGNK